MKDIKVMYAALQQKYGLAAFDVLDREFEIACIEDKNFSLREIRHKISDALCSFIDVLEEVLQPDTQISQMYEARAFSEDEKKVVFELYSRIKQLYRKYMIVAVTNEEAVDAQFIKDALKQWPDIKKGMLSTLEKMRSSWEIEPDEATGVWYLG